MTNQQKQQLINYLTSVELTDKSKRKYSPSQKTIANFELKISLNNRTINIYRFVDLYHRIFKHYEKAIKSSLNPMFSWTGKISQPTITAEIKQTEIYRTCLFTGFIVQNLKQYIPEITYTLTILK